MNLPTITDIKIKNSSGNKNSNTILVSTRKFDPNTHRIILRVNKKFYDDLEHHIKELVIDQGDIQSQLPRMNESLTIYAQLYDYKNDRIVCTKKKDFVKTLGSWELALGNSIINISNDYFNLFWNSNRKVVKVNGPFDKDGKLQAEVKPGERYYFTAEPNQKLHSVELLSAKWAYRYDDGELIKFKNHNEIISNGFNMMDCIFHNEPKKIKVYAYFFDPNEKVMVEFSNFRKVNDIEEEPANNVEEKTKQPLSSNSEQFNITVDFLDKFMSATPHGSINKISPYNKRIPAYIDFLNIYMEKFGIKKNKQRIAHFLGQVAKETKFWSYNEDFIYAVGKLDDSFANFRTVEGKEFAKQWEYKNNKNEITKEIQAMIANYAYAKGKKAADLGNTICENNNLKDPKQDGYNYRGRGLIQITGKQNYKNFQQWFNTYAGELNLEKIDFIKNPDKVLDPVNLVLSAIYFWDQNKLNNLADKGIESKHILAISNVINSGEGDDKKKIRKDYVLAAYNLLSETDTIKQDTSTNPLTQNADSKWHDPVDNPQITLHNFSGSYDPDFSSFGGHRGRPHTGLDIFAINKKTKIYACMKGHIVFSESIPGYGKSIVLEVDKNELEKHRKNYSLKYDKEVIKGNLYDSGNKRYILYAHLNSYEFRKNEVEAGDIIAISGVTGIAEGTHGPHLHIEFSSKKLPQKGDGYKYRCNPLCYINLSNANLQLQKSYNKTNRSTDKI
ncbi:hypothetical protein [uncultured Chryseobacterium sp.]|uniref:hypothetical protein n=1 Tax=uncultured Chryseobacterium sp. TaxID=259322 RepID=UPI0025F07855|nr:hypothetical protein [uncultured Chryseobacterium sp.]